MNACVTGARPSACLRGWQADGDGRGSPRDL